MRCVFFVLCLWVFNGAFGQKTIEDSVVYTREYQFDEGIYLNFKDLKNKSAIAYSQIVSAYPKDQPDFWQQILKEKTVVYLDKQGEQDTVKTTAIFALSVANQLYLFTNGYHAKAKVIGTLIYAASNTDVEFIYATEERKAMDFDTDHLIRFFALHDPELGASFKALKKRDQFASRLIYLRKYNEKHPLYLSAK